MPRFNILLAGLLLALPAAAHAENWRLAGGNRDAGDYVDVDSIARSGNSVRYLRETRFSDVQSTQSGLRFDRMIVVYTADCRARSVQAMRVRVTLDGREMYAYDSRSGLEYPRPGTIGESVLLSVCENRWPN
jgi:hypothetical protein